MGAVVTARWHPWAAYEDGELNRYFDWDTVTGGIEPTWRGESRKALFFPELTREDEGILNENLSKVKASLQPGTSVQARKANTKVPNPAHNLLAPLDYQRVLVLLMVQTILSQFKNAVLRLPPVPNGSASTCPNSEGSPSYLCYFRHILLQSALPEPLLPGKGSAKLPDDMKVPEDTVIAGVVDVGIPLGHHATRLPNGKTRILAAWQQTANRVAQDGTPDNKANQFYLPSGREVLADEINNALQVLSSPDPRTGYLDEEEFNRRLGLEDYTTPFGQRDLGQRASHGAHVLGTSVGMDPDDDRAGRTRIIAVNMPDRSLVGHSAQFLEYFAIHGIMRVVMLADALWDKQHGKTSTSDLQSFPIVINLSFGKQASSRDGLDPLTRFLQELNDFRATQKRRPVILSLPAGNENLNRGNIRSRIPAGAEVTFDWRVQPEDQSANFVEIWSDHRAVEEDEESPLAIELRAPNSLPSVMAGGKHHEVLDYSLAPSGADVSEIQNGLLARVYSERQQSSSTSLPTQAAHRDTLEEQIISVLQSFQNGDAAGSVELDEDRASHERPSLSRQFYLIATKQTALFEDTPVAPSGVWRIRLRNRSEKPIMAYVNIQSDQTEHPRLVVNQRSYFERPEYVRFDETGRPVDTATYPLDGSRPEVTDISPVLRRHGTINALGFTKESFLAAGHRDSDGRMAPYSSSGLFRASSGGPLPKREQSRKEGAAPFVSFPTRDGAAHYGTLASGSRDGTCVAQEGTSFAAAQLTRRLIELFLDDRNADAEAILACEAQAEEARGVFPGRAVQLKMGHGRLGNPVRPRVARPNNY